MNIHLPKTLNYFFHEAIAFMKLFVHGSKICWINSLSIGGEFRQTWQHLFRLTAMVNLADRFVLYSIVVKAICVEIYWISSAYDWSVWFLQTMTMLSPYQCSFRKEIGKSFHIVTFSYDRSADYSLMDFCFACLCFVENKHFGWVKYHSHRARVFTRKFSVYQSNFSLVFHVVQARHFSSTPGILLVPCNKPQALLSVSNKQVNIYLP